MSILNEDEDVNIDRNLLRRLFKISSKWESLKEAQRLQYEFLKLMTSDTPGSLDSTRTLPSSDIRAPIQIEGKEEVLTEMGKIGTEIDEGLVKTTNQLIDRVRNFLDPDPVNCETSDVNFF